MKLQYKEEPTATGLYFVYGSHLKGLLYFCTVFHVR